MLINVSANRVDSFTKLFLAAQGAVGSTTVLDSSLTGKAVTNSGVSVISATGASCPSHIVKALSFSGATLPLTVVDSPDWTLGSADFSIDMWVAPGSITAAGYCLLEQGTDVNNYWSFGFLNSTNVYFYHKSAGTLNVNISQPLAVTAATWMHLFLGRRGGNTYSFHKDGSKLVGDITNATVLGDFSGPLVVGYGPYSPVTTFQGQIAKLRITKGLCRWTRNFIPPNKPY